MSLPDNTVAFIREACERVFSILEGAARAEEVSRLVVRVQPFRVQLKKSYKWAEWVGAIDFPWKENSVIQSLVEKVIPNDILDGYGDGFAQFIRFMDNVIYKHLFDDVAGDGRSPEDDNKRHFRGHVQKYMTNQGAPLPQKRLLYSYEAAFMIMIIKEVDAGFALKFQKVEDGVASAADQESDEYWSVASWTLPTGVLAGPPSDSMATAQRRTEITQGEQRCADQVVGSIEFTIKVMKPHGAAFGAEVIVGGSDGIVIGCIKEGVLADWNRAHKEEGRAETKSSRRPSKKEEDAEERTGLLGSSEMALLMEALFAFSPKSANFRSPLHMCVMFLQRAKYAVNDL